MEILKGPASGESVELTISSSKTNRLLVGLNWNPKPFKGHDDEGYMNDPDVVGETASEWIRNFDRALFDYLGDIKRSALYLWYVQKGHKRKDFSTREDKYSHFDLDLYCYIFDQNGELQSKIGPADLHAIDPSETTYHSGDNFSGLSATDDEQIHIETKHAPDHHHHYFFLVRSDCKFNLDEIKDPNIRLADSKTNDNILEIKLIPEPSDNTSAYLFCQVYRKEDKWFAKNLSEYGQFEDDWESRFKQLIEDLE